jgi:hypothetical protein
LADTDDVLVREVSATPAEFAHGLRLAFPGKVAGGPLEFLVEDGVVALAISLVPGPDRVIALLRLPTLTARLRFTAGDTASRARLLRRMDLAMQRGGG